MFKSLVRKSSIDQDQQKKYSAFGLLFKFQQRGGGYKKWF